MCGFLSCRVRYYSFDDTHQIPVRHQQTHLNSNNANIAYMRTTTRRTRKWMLQLSGIPIYKLLLVGDNGVGKSSLLLRFTEKTFPTGYIATIGVDFKLKTIQLDGTAIKLMIWDTTGGERFRCLSSSHWRSTSGVLFIYDVTNQESFDHLVMNWIKQADEALDKATTSWQLVGNKCDLTKSRQVDYETAKEFADQQGIPLVETSAKDSTNVDIAFVRLSADIKKKKSVENKGNSGNMQLQNSVPTTSVRNCSL